MYVLSLHTPASAMKPPCKGSKENVDSAINNTSIHDLPGSQRERKRKSESKLLQGIRIPTSFKSLNLTPQFTSAPIDLLSCRSHHLSASLR